MATWLVICHACLISFTHNFMRLSLAPCSWNLWMESISFVLKEALQSLHWCDPPSFSAPPPPPPSPDLPAELEDDASWASCFWSSCWAPLTSFCCCCWVAMNSFCAFNSAWLYRAYCSNEEADSSSAPIPRPSAPEPRPVKPSPSPSSPPCSLT